MISKRNLFLLCTILLLGCAERDPGITLSVEALHHSAPDMFGNYTDTAAGEPRAFTSESGYDITIEKGYVVLFNEELLAQANAFDFVPRFFQRVFGVSDAFAHALSSPTTIATPQVIALLGAERVPLVLGELSPPPGVYDRLEVNVLQADEDARDLPGDVPGTMVGKSLYLEGTWQPAGMGGAGTAFTISTAIAATAQLPLRAPGGAPDPHSLPGSTSRVIVGIGYETWFDSADFMTMNQSQLAIAVMGEVQASLSHFVDPVADSE